MEIVVTARSGAVDPQVRQEIEGIDQALRKSFSGLDVDAVSTEVERSFEHLDVTLDPATVRAYATAISDRADFELTLD